MKIEFNQPIYIDRCVSDWWVSMAEEDARYCVIIVLLGLSTQSATGGLARPTVRG